MSTGGLTDSQGLEGREQAQELPSAGHCVQQVQSLRPKPLDAPHELLQSTGGDTIQCHVTVMNQYCFTMSLYRNSRSGLSDPSLSKLRTRSCRAQEGTPYHITAELCDTVHCNRVMQTAAYRHSQHSQWTRRRAWRPRPSWQNCVILYTVRE